ncbi:hypothetical protein SAMCCGM7_Ch2027 [Sinorhizobium americanum CCGM7]|nr:hypothetical protein SAMCCGM7_Ch2027 [Sinorhizobium americanum CCGM7]
MTVRPVDHRRHGEHGRLEVPARLGRSDRLRRRSHGLVNSLSFSCARPPYRRQSPNGGA